MCPHKSRNEVLNRQNQKTEILPANRDIFPETEEELKEFSRNLEGGAENDKNTKKFCWWKTD